MNVEMPESSDWRDAFEHFSNWVAIMALFTITWILQLLIASEALTTPQKEELANLGLPFGIVSSPWTIMMWIGILWLSHPLLYVMAKTIVAKHTGDGA